MEISWQIVRHQLASPFGISKGVYTHRNALILTLAQDNHQGYGEATEIPYYHIRLGRLIDLLQDHLTPLRAIELDTPAQYFEHISPLLNAEPFLLSAFDCAAHDLYGKINQRKIVNFLGYCETDPTPLSSYTIGLAEPAVMQQKIQAKPWPLYKIKLAGRNDLLLLQTLREVTPAPFVIDANEAWSIEQTQEYLPALADLNVQMVEQPVHRDIEQDLTQIKERPVPIFADESCHNLADIKKCATLYDGINIKLMKCGGLTPAHAMIEKARTQNLQVMVGCMTESSIGISAAAQLAPAVDFLDLDGAMLLDHDPAIGVRFENGKLIYAEAFGNGCLTSE